jgi:uncharacterized protein (TIGR04222 family)
MNPLDLTGPEFLRFYVPYGLSVLALAWLIRALVHRTLGPQPDARWTPGTYPREGDAYAIAFLRGGSQEAVRTVLGRLVSAGLVNVEDRQVSPRPEPRTGGLQLQPIEKAAWSALEHGVPLHATEAEQCVQIAMEPHLREIQDSLATQGLLPTHRGRTVFQALMGLTWLAVGGLGLAKLGVALARGRFNVGFLFVLLLLFTWAIVRWLRPPQQTLAGQRYLAWLRESHRGLVEMLTSGRRDSSGELALAVGIYGLAAVPGLSDLGVAFNPPPEARRDGGSSSGCGSGGDGGGSSCGGGGCGGGGCGGCGG